MMHVNHALMLISGLSNALGCVLGETVDLVDQTIM